MKKACPCLAGAAALLLGVTVAASPREPAPAGSLTTEKAADKTPPRNPNSPYKHTAIGTVLDANGGKPPRTGEELIETLAKIGDFVQLPVSFSAVALDSGLTHPRVVITMRPSSHPAPREVIVAPKPDDKPGPDGKPVVKKEMVTPPGEPLNRVAANRTQLEGRLFLAANTDFDKFLNPVVKTVEFISWNTKRVAFDFGVIEGLGGGTPELKILDGVRCFSCHKNRGPILGVSPWSNTTNNGPVLTTAAHVLNIKPHTLFDGLSLQSNATEVDAAVRCGGDMLRNREVFKQLSLTANGRKSLALLMAAVCVRGPLEATDKQIKANLNALTPQRFLRDAATAIQVVPPSALIDFSPAGPLSDGRVWVPQNFVSKPLMDYDEVRATGEHKLPSTHVPSNPRAFVRSPAKNLTHASEVVSATILAQTLGLTEKDREFLAAGLDETVRRLNNPSATPATVAIQVFSGPFFDDVLKSGKLPDRDDFKDRFTEGLIVVLGRRNPVDEFWVKRDAYASAPRFDPREKREKEVVVLPSHACLGCHDVRGVGKPAFNPIPQLSFDPFDTTAREAWLKTADRTQKAEVLGRFVKRLVTDRTMPPEDSTEYEMYRMKDAASFNAVKDWLEAELKKAKQN